MQSACLDEFGGEKAVPPKHQETTLIQHIFGGHLQSEVRRLITLRLKFSGLSMDTFLAWYHFVHSNENIETELYCLQLSIKSLDDACCVYSLPIS